MTAETTFYKPGALFVHAPAGTKIALRFRCVFDHNYHVR